MFKLTINGTAQQLDIDPAMPLLWAIRDHAGLTGTKYGRGMALCGVCTVHLDGSAVRACGRCSRRRANRPHQAFPVTTGWQTFCRCRTERCGIGAPQPAVCNNMTKH